MDAITQAEIFALIAEINSFADSSETLINNSRSTYEQNKQALLNRHTATLSQLEKVIRATVMQFPANQNAPLKMLNKCWQILKLSILGYLR